MKFVEITNVSCSPKSDEHQFSSNNIDTMSRKRLGES